MIDTTYDSVRSYLDRHFETYEIDHSQAVKVGSVLISNHPEHHTNATIIGIDPEAKHRQVKVLTDIGNVINITLRELAGMYSVKCCRVLRDKTVEVLPEYLDAVEMGQLKVTYKDLLNKANEATGLILESQGYQLMEGTTFHDAIHPHDKWVFDTVCKVIETLHPNVDMEEVISYASDSE